MSVLSVLTGCAAHQPGTIETRVAQFVKRKVTVGGRGDPNPLPATVENIRAGQQAFSHYCLVCHGLDGQNTGVPFADTMSPEIPPLSSPMIQSYSDGQLKWIIENGLRPSGMPASKGILSDQDMWTIVVYLRHLPPAGSLGEPRAYSGDEYAK